MRTSGLGRVAAEQEIDANPPKPPPKPQIDDLRDRQESEIDRLIRTRGLSCEDAVQLINSRAAERAGTTPLPDENDFEGRVAHVMSVANCSKSQAEFAVREQIREKRGAR
jgi:hypothetical protein